MIKKSILSERIESKLTQSFFDNLITLLFIVFIISPLFTFFYKTNMHIALNFKSTIATAVGNLLILSVIFKKVFYVVSNKENDFKCNSFKQKLKTFFKIHPEYFILFFMILWSFFSSLFSEYRDIAFNGNGYRLEGFSQYFAYAGFFVAAISLRDKSKWKFILDSFLVVSYIAAILGIIEHFGVRLLFWSTFPRCSSLFINTNHFGYYLVIATILSAYVWMNEKKQKIRYLHLIGYILLAFVLIYTDTRGVWIAHCLGLVFLSYFISYKEGRIFKPVTLTPLFITATVFLIISLFENSSHILRLTSIFKDSTLALSNTEKSNEAGSGRWILWKYGIEFAFSKPIFGHGPDTFGELYALYDIDMDRPHNEYIQYAATIGIPGLLLYLSSLFIIIKRAIKNIKNVPNIYIVVLCACIGYLISAFFGNTTTYVTPYFWMLLGYLSTSDL